MHKTHANNSLPTYKQRDLGGLTNTLVMRRFIGTLIYLGLYPTSRREDY